MTRVDDAATATILQFRQHIRRLDFRRSPRPFGHHHHGSLCDHARALGLGAPPRRPRNRVSSYSVWETAVFCAQRASAFVLMGLQARPFLDRLFRAGRVEALILGVVVLATVVLVRLAWVLAAGATVRLVSSWFGGQWHVSKHGMRGRSARRVVWYRGLVTLATAFRAAARISSRDPIVLRP